MGTDAAQRSHWISEMHRQVLTFHSDQHRDTPIDVFVHEPFDFAAEYEHALVQRLADDVPVRIVGLDALLKLKRDAARPQDLADVAELLSIHRPFSP